MPPLDPSVDGGEDQAGGGGTVRLVKTEELAKTLQGLVGDSYRPTETQLRVVAKIMRGPTRRERIARRIQKFTFFCERVGTVVAALPRTGPTFAREFWGELRRGDEPAVMALGWGFVAVCLLGSVALLAVASQH
ncbi:MAG TPA: hypothetical protein VIJ21_00650 [Solirubrobacterales bacterium]